ncbi:hypothetical protein LEL_04229 [Akanthomyces lecanii RCEF 1005]|uniref:Uncharacterized protein n=1 Tax=Akanthomyces lecanii RCEF 1005 TaxID=1081108 RepID=A0A168H7H9_CORDF|nr:hypothetical protein LEL_04229 [Akanthomyces lecanii RCEF 1005]
MVGIKRKRADSARDGHPRKRTQDLPCPSWVFPPSSNTHVASDRSWFCDDYRPISSSIFGSPVICIGTVLLPVKVSFNDPADGEKASELARSFMADEGTRLRKR